MSEPVLTRGTFTLVFPPGTFAAEQPPNLLWPWITPPSHPAELPSVQSHPSSCSPACVPWNVPIPELLETAGTSPCSFPAALAVSSPFHPQRFAWNTGKKLPLQGLLWSFLGVGREKVFLRGFKPFQLTLHPEQATANPQSSLNLLSHALLLSISQLLVFLPSPCSKLAFFFLFWVGDVV